MNFFFKINLIQISDSESEQRQQPSAVLLSIFSPVRILPTPYTIHEICSRKEGKHCWRDSRCFGKIQGDSGKFGFGTTMRTEGRKERNGRSNCQGTSRVPNLRFVRAYARGTPQLPKSESAQLRAPLFPSLNAPRRPESARGAHAMSLLLDSSRGFNAFRSGRGEEESTWKYVGTYAPYNWKWLFFECRACRWRVFEMKNAERHFSSVFFRSLNDFDRKGAGRKGAFDK